MNKDTLIREFKNRASSWHTLAGIYVIIICALVLSASNML